MSNLFRRPTEPAGWVDRTLCVAAHPDDLDFGSAGSVARWILAGTEVTFCVVTHGEAGASNSGMKREAIKRMRRGEQRQAAEALGVTNVRFLNYPDGRLEPSLELRRDITRVIRQVKPQRVITSSPERNWEWIDNAHPDHMAAGEATLRAVYPDARNPLAFPELLQIEGLDAWTVDEVWVYGTARADHAVDVTETVSHKLAAVKSHESQVGHIDDLDNSLIEWMRLTAARFDLPAGRLAEAFHIVHTA